MFPWYLHAQKSSDPVEVSAAADDRLQGHRAQKRALPSQLLIRLRAANEERFE